MKNKTDQADGAKAPKAPKASAAKPAAPKAPAARAKPVAKAKPAEAPSKAPAKPRKAPAKGVQAEMPGTERPEPPETTPAPVAVPQERVAPMLPPPPAPVPETPPLFVEPEPVAPPSIVAGVGSVRSLLETVGSMVAGLGGGGGGYVDPFGRTERPARVVVTPERCEGSSVLHIHRPGSMGVQHVNVCGFLDGVAMLDGCPVGTRGVILTPGRRSRVLRVEPKPGASWRETIVQETRRESHTRIAENGWAVHEPRDVVRSRIVRTMPGVVVEVERERQFIIPERERGAGHGRYFRALTGEHESMFRW